MGLSAEGFFLPKEARQALLGENPPFQSWTLRYGQPCAAEDPQAVTARWPLLQPPQWEGLLDILGRNRARVPQGEAYWERFRQALARAGRCLADPADPRHQKALQTLPLYTGYSSSMVQLALRALDWFSLDDYAALFSFTPTWRSAVRFQRMGELPGWLRFYPRSRWHAWLGALPLVKDLPLLHRLPPPGLILGYGAGNVPGTALLIALLAQTLALVTAIPSIVIRNSRHEPIFGPLVLQALEEADPELVSTTALLVWDYEDETLQRFLLRRADLMIAAASDTTIAALEKQCQTVRRAHPQRRAPRLHPHGHKVSFAAIGGEFLGEQGGDPLSGAPWPTVVARLAALDSVAWDQNGCLSARVHFVVNDPEGGDRSEIYAAALLHELRRFSRWLPLGAWPRGPLHERFDRYKAMERGGQVRVLSSYDEDFLLLIDRRPWEATTFRRLVNDCQGRTIVVRPVLSSMEIPRRYLRLIPPQNLQSLSVALSTLAPGQESAFLEFVAACGACGVTAIRSLGRGAFPHLAYSWDGWLPVDLLAKRREGHFTTIEFTHLEEQLSSTYRLIGLPEE